MIISAARFHTCSLLIASGLCVGACQAASNILIWPIDPYLPPDEKAAELWIQNQGTTPTTMQVRVVRWRQEEGFERYVAQQDVAASPPIVRIGGGKKQLIRLISQAQVPMGVEQAYRVVVDEIPQPQDNSKPQLGLKLQMRYSIPLFVYGQGIETQRSGAHHAFVNPARLSWRLAQENGKPAIEIINNDEVHARISKVSVRQGGQQHTLADGLWGYVLPRSSRLFPLPAGIASPTELSASLNARDSRWLATPRQADIR